MYWTKKHDEWCLVFNLRPSAQLLWRWINRRTKGNTTEQIEIDLRKFNKWVEKKRLRPFDAKTVKEAIAQLFERTEGLITQWKKITWYYYKIVVKPISFLEQKNNPQNGITPTADRLNPAWNGVTLEEQIKQQQQSISKLDTMLRGLGLRYDRDALNRIWAFSGKCFNRVKQAIELMLYRHQTKAIPKPHGFLIDCLKNSWQDGFNIYYEPELPKFDKLDKLSQFVNKLLPLHEYV